MITLLLSLAASVVAPAASADLASEPQVLHVRYADLDLNSHGGRAELRRRLDRAAVAVCDDSPGLKTQSESRLILTCKRSARAQAADQYQRAIGEAVAARTGERPKL
jgi:UrcA family protein